MARMPGLSGGLPLVYVVYSRKKYVGDSVRPPARLSCSAPIRNREKGTYFGTRGGEQDALAGAGRFSHRNPTRDPRPRPSSISTDPLSWGSLCAHSCLSQE
jgi:hypothetical protein